MFEVYGTKAYDKTDLAAACWLCFVLGASVGVGISGVIWPWL